MSDIGHVVSKWEVPTEVVEDLVESCNLTEPQARSAAMVVFGWLVASMGTQTTVDAMVDAGYRSSINGIFDDETPGALGKHIARRSHIAGAKAALDAIGVTRGLAATCADLGDVVGTTPAERIETFVRANTGEPADDESMAAQVCERLGLHYTGVDDESLSVARVRRAVRMVAHNERKRIAHRLTHGQKHDVV